MAEQIILTINKRSDYTVLECLRQAMELIEKDNTSGILGWSEDTWDLEVKEVE